MDRAREIIVDARVDATPENYEICHRHITRSDPNVCAAFERVLREANSIDAASFARIREMAGPPRGHIDAAKHMANFDQQIGLLLRSTANMADDTAAYSGVLTRGAADLDRLGVDAKAVELIHELVAHTRSMTDRVTSLESSLATASDELFALREDLDKARRESGTDALTSLPNRRSFDNRLAEAAQAASISAEPLSLAFCDIDHFKQFNDTWGHKLGDEVLRYVAAQMVKHFGTSALPARFGGEEFVVLFANCDTAAATEAMREYCAILSGRTLKVRADGKDIGKITLSVGIATLLPDESPASLIARADEAMYAAKQAGRNRIVGANAAPEAN